MPEPTIPVAHLTALGFERSDPPVQTENGYTIGWLQWRSALIARPGYRLSVEHSFGTLLRALARQHDMPLGVGEVPTWHEDSRSRSRWRLGTQWGEQIFAPAGEGFEGYADPEVVPTLTADMGRLEALAAIIAWQVSR